MQENRAAQRPWVAPLVKWYEENERPLPWRKDKDPYHVWISEIMLQQTRIEAVMEYYRRFMQTLPDVHALASADEDTVLKLWEGLGYYSRARNLHKAAKIIDAAGSFPDQYESIRQLPGIGDYTAGAISAISFSRPEVAVDGNVMRVVSRLELLEENVLNESARKTVRALLKENYPFKADDATGEIIYQSSSFVQGLMELGEVICLPASPLCGDCPLSESCGAFREGRCEELPVRIRKQTRREETRMVLLLRNEEGKYLFFKRPEDAVLKGLWEFPNVLADADEETGEEDSKARLLREYGIETVLFSSEGFLKEAKHVFSHITWKMKVYTGEIRAEAAKELEENLRGTYCWADPCDIMIPTAFKKLL